MFTSEDVIELYGNWESAGVRSWLVGGWGVDALLKKQTRPHKDLDILVEARQLHQLWASLAKDGFVLKYLWPETLQTKEGDDNSAQETAFVVGDAAGREIDVHALIFDELDRPSPAWNAGGWTLKREDLDGVGMIEGERVHCMAADMQLAVHSVYELPEGVAISVQLLHDMFGIDDVDAK